jgi:hypothetical protein
MTTEFKIVSDFRDATPNSWDGAPCQGSFRSFNDAENEIERMCIRHDAEDHHPSEYEIHGDDGSRYTWQGDDNWFVLVPGTAPKAEPEKIYRPAKGFDFVVVSTPTLIFVGVKRRDEFDKIESALIDAGLGEDGHVLVKRIEEGKFTHLPALAHQARPHCRAAGGVGSGRKSGHLRGRLTRA